MKLVGADRSDPPTPSPAVPPVASVLPPGQVVHLNHSANLTCVATGKPQPQLSWLHNGAPIEGSSPGVTLTPTSLFITMATAEDAGVYTCSADNGIGRVIAMATVTILCKLPAFLLIWLCWLLLLILPFCSPTRPARFCHLSSSVREFHWCDMVPRQQWGFPHYRLFSRVPAINGGISHLGTCFHGNHLHHAEWPHPL